ncbi:MAG: ATP-binding protein [Rhodanobacter sp.]
MSTLTEPVQGFRQCWIRGAAVILSLVLSLGSARAAIPQETLGSFQMSTFEDTGGSLGNFSELAQTSDGFLWIQATRGLVRFDGVQFARFVPLPGEHFLEAQLNMIFPAQGQGLWISNENAGPTLLKNGHLIHFGAKQGYVGTDGYFFTGPHGHVWSVTTQAIMYFKDGSWHAMKAASGPDQMFSRAAFDGSGNLWVNTRHGSEVLVIPAGTTTLVSCVHVEHLMEIFVGRSGRIYANSRDNGIHIYRRNGITLTEVAAPIPLFAFALTETRSGAVWVTSEDHKITYISPAALKQAEENHATPQSEMVPRQQGFYWPLLEDRDGNIWVGRSGNLDHFTRTTLTNIKLPEAIYAVSPSMDGSGGLWVGNYTMPVFHVAENPYSLETTLAPDPMLATFSDMTDGSAWGANRGGLWQFSPGKPHQVVAYPATFHFATLPYSLIRDQQKVLFVSTPSVGNGLMAWDGKSWHDVLHEPTVVKVMALDQQNRLWIGSRERDHLIELSNGIEHVWTARQGVDVGAVRSILADGNLLWIGGNDGVQYFDGRRFISLLATEPKAFQTVIGLVRDGDGNLWVQNLEEIFRIPATEIRKALADSDTRVTFSTLNAADGVPPAPDADRTLPSLRLSTDGRVWAHSLTGLAWVDPKNIPRHSSLPPIVIETLTSGSTSHSLSTANITLPPSQDSFRIAYTIPALSHPDRVNFSYRLAGFSDWQDAGARREAVFTHVPPGNYRFEVQAFGEQGVASITSEPLMLIRLPAWYQTWWFRTLALLPLILLLWLAYALRMRVLQRRMQIRVDERERIARDLHDTLLQSVQGLQLRLQTWAADKSLEPKRRQEMSTVALNTREMLIDGRDRIIALRRTDASRQDLATALRAAGEEYASLYGPRYVMTMTGEPRPLLPDAESEVLDVIREGLRNAFVHANANDVELTITWRAIELRVSVSDDGVGISEKVLHDGGRAGHWGLLGMRERAAKMGGHLELHCPAEGGTELMLVVPARMAYERVYSRLPHFVRRAWNGFIKEDQPQNAPPPSTSHIESTDSAEREALCSALPARTADHELETN